MIVERTRVSGEWLDLREPADAAARNPELVQHLRRHLPSTGCLVIHDLGCGTGSMGRWLAPLLPGPQHWVLHDRDEDLLDVAAAEPPGPAADGARVSVETRPSDVTRLRPGDLADASLVTASALLDLLTRDELDAVDRRLHESGMPGPPEPLRRRSRRSRPGGSAGLPRRRRVRRPPAPHDGTRPPARPGRRRRRRRGIPSAGRRGARPADPLAARRR